jgi:hypothetical protein
LCFFFYFSGENFQNLKKIELRKNHHFHLDYRGWWVGGGIFCSEPFSFFFWIGSRNLFVCHHNVAFAIYIKKYHKAKEEEL